MTDISLLIDPNLKSYESFWDKEWAENILELVKPTKLLPVFDDLVIAWRGAADVYRQPWLTIEEMRAFATGMTDAYVPFGLKYVDAVYQRILPIIKSDSKKRKKVYTALKLLFQEMKVANDKAPRTSFSARDFWDKRLVKKQDFGLVLVASQRMCYAWLYFGYEHFLLGSYRLATGKKDYRIRNAEEFTKDVTTVFGKPICDACLTDSSIEIARLTRNALAHSGGRETPQLQLKKHGFRVEDGKVFILPADNKALHKILKDRVCRVAAKTVELLIAK